MKIASRFAAVLVLVVCAVLAVTGYVDARRVVSLYEDELESDLKLLSRVLSAGVVRIWSAEGWQAALAFLEQAEEAQNDVLIRWVWLDDVREGYEPRVTLDVIRPLIDGERDIVLDYRYTGRPEVVLYRPVSLRGLPLGAIEVSRCTSHQQAYVEGVIRNEVLSSALVLVVYGIIASLLGRWFIARPVQALIAQARRIGAGSFSERTTITQRDEIGELAREMNLMSTRLDVARRRAKEERRARQAAEEQLRHADRLAAVGTLAASITHDIGTPLNVISGRAMMIARSEAEPREVSSNAEIIAEQSRRIASMIRNLLDFARRPGARRERQDLLEILRPTVELLEPLARKGRVRLSLEQEASRLACVVDATAIRQVLSNLIMNAIQAMPDGGQVTVRASEIMRKTPGGEAQRFAALQVRDEGRGIPEDQLPHIFEPFFTTKAEGEGTGLGLSVSRGIVEEHHGFLEVESEVGAGSCFTVLLPLAQGPGKEDAPKQHLSADTGAH